MAVRYVATGGTPIKVEPRRCGNGLKVSQGNSYLMIKADELEMLVEAMRDVCNQI